MSKNKPEEQKKPATAAMAEYREGFNPDDAQEVELSAKWFVCEAGAVHHFIALERSEDVRDVFPPRPGEPNDREKRVWKCELLGSAILMQDGQPVQGVAGDLFLMFEPARMGLRAVLNDSRQYGFGVTFINHGKKPRFLRKQNTTRPVWDIKAKILPKRFEPLSNPSLLALPAPEQAAKLPETVTALGEAAD